MSFFNTNADRNVVRDIVSFDYNRVSIYKNDIVEQTTNPKRKSSPAIDKGSIEGELIPNKETYFKIDFPNKSPNFSYANMKPHSYTATHMYLFGLLHNNISGVSVGNKDIVGELVIEHANNMANTGKVYTCFLLKRGDKSSDSTFIDSLVGRISTDRSNNKEIVSDLNTIIPNQKKCFYYTDMPQKKWVLDEKIKNHVFLFYEPIVIQPNTAKYILDSLSTNVPFFNTNSSSDTVNIDIQPGGIMEGMVEGNEDNLYIDCQPTGESDETIQAYSIPIKSEYGDSKGKIDFMRTIVNMCMFLMIAAGAYFIVPPFYKNSVIDKINIQNIDDLTTRKKNISLADNTLITVFITYILYAFYLGITYTDMTSFIYIGFALSITAASMYSIVQSKKLDDEFMTTRVENKPPIKSLFSIDEPVKLSYGEKFAFISTLFGIAFSQENRMNFILTWIIMYVMMMVIVNIFVFSKIDENEQSTSLWEWAFPLFILNTTIITPAIFLSIT